MVFAYGTVAVILLVVGLATKPRSSSPALVALAALVWPLTMAAIAIQAYLLEPPGDRTVDTKTQNVSPNAGEDLHRYSGANVQ